MPKLLLQLHISLDGYIADTNNDILKWITFNFSSDLNEYLERVTASVDHIILGRKLAEGFIPAWASRPSDEPGVKKMNETKKLVLSKTLREKPESWGENASLTPLDVDAGDVVRKLKDGEGGDLIAYGGVDTVRFLVGEGLVDEMVLLVSPVALGQGAKLFTTRSDWEVVDAKSFECGIIVLRYRLKM